MFHLVGLLLLTGCAPKLATSGCAAHLGPGAYTCPVPGWEARAYSVVLPRSYDGKTPIPVVMDLHGGGGSKVSAARETCVNGDPKDPSCLHNRLANREGFAVVYPDGHPGKGIAENLRTWNAGGGRGKWRATGQGAVDAKVDDTRFIGDLLDDLESRMAVDPRRIYAAGLSNGGAMSHRLACTLSDRIAAVAPIGGGMQWTTTHECAPSRPVPVLYIHGTGDRCWKYAGGPSDCPIGQAGKEHVSAERTLRQWAEINGCTGDPVQSVIEPTTQGGRTTIRTTWPDCEADLVHLKVEGGGHVWPNGWQYLGEGTVGPVWRDWGNEVLWDFFAEHPLPQ